MTTTNQFCIGNLLFSTQANIFLSEGAKADIGEKAYAMVKPMEAKSLPLT